MTIPSLGIGTWKLSGDACTLAVASALEVGYRHVDTADRYGNHRDVARAIAESGVAREDIFLTSKVWREELGYRQVHEAATRFLEELQTDYFDLLLVHWPNRETPIEETFTAFTELKNTGVIKEYGVSNFTRHHLEDVLAAGYTPFCNQVELHPSFNQKELHEFCKEKNILLTAYSPLGMGEELQNETVIELSGKYSVSPAQVILNWIMASGVVAIPKSTNPNNIEDNFKSQNWKMEDEDIEKMNNIPQGTRLLSPEYNEFDY